MSRATFVVTFQAPVASDGIRELRGILKVAGRRFGLRAIDVCKASRPPSAPVAEGKRVRRQETVMDMKKFCGSQFVKLADVEAGPIRGVIADIREGKFGRPDLEFDTGEKLSLNATNNRVLVKEYGTDSDLWIGKEIELFKGMVEFGGETQPAVLVKPISPSIPKKPAPPKQPLRDDLDDTVPF
jgi:hypothetical protein